MRQRALVACLLFAAFSSSSPVSGALSAVPAAADDSLHSTCERVRRPDGAPALLQVRKGVLQAERSGSEGRPLQLGQTTQLPDYVRGLYFRPLSRTLHCVMTLTVVSLCGYTALSVARNIDELSGATQPSLATQALTVASRGCAAMPMLSMLCVSCRMYVLDVSEGLGEPPDATKLCMLLSTAGLLLQTLFVLVLPGFTSAGSEQGEASYNTSSAARDLLKRAWASNFASATGGHCDVHPDLGRLQYRNSRVMKPLFWLVQVVSLLLVYGGAAGVIVSVFTFPRQADSKGIPPAILCTLFLSVVYFAVYLALWVARTLPESAAQEAMVHSSLATSSSVRKAPMFCVAFLGSRMRSLQLSPPHGNPPEWMQACFLAVTICVYLEVLLAMLVGATCTLRKAYYGEHVFRPTTGAGKVLKLLQHLCAIASYVAIAPVITGQIAIRDAAGGTVALSTTMWCVMIFQGAYFTVMMGKTASFFLEDIFSCDLHVLCDTFVAAGISLSLAPVLCILFVATRMRALQITQQQGSPPGWTQDLMVVSLCASCVQAACCLVMPMFLGTTCQVDDEGNADYDLRPMIGAYAVTMVKYVALMSLHGAVLLICWSVVTMTPDSARGSTSRAGMDLVHSCTIFALVFVLALLFSSAKVVGLVVKLTIESCDRAILGVDVTIRKASLSVCRGYVKISQLVVHQPDQEILFQKDSHGAVRCTPTGKELSWKEDCLASIDTLLVDIDMGQLLSSFGRVFRITHLVFKGVHFNIEKPDIHLSNMNSNLDYVINCVTSLAGADDETASQGDTVPQEAPAADFSDTKVILHKIEVGDITAGMTVRNVPVVGELSFHPSVGVISFDDVQSEVFGGRGSDEGLSPEEVVRGVVVAVVAKVSRMVLLSVPKHVAQATRSALSAGSSPFKAMGDKLSRSPSCRGGGDKTCCMT